ncbi:hypothetical protein PACTADRAFT_50398 [Pachysolen tannophilus NRRL Y-2460]|uniref:D-xylose 1-dehydrogenase (NADP(+), D-xylono-1,5-lactone-forming) n=1 Tax=Pachysolen tannophilus NRRL Y-2460 TaxID=669874 RepID=A0A1E4TVF5_PACTA|nr:hypothetical protein PACTADRAFT_50398 [Pachysolen tannophilus NRRL Y-2460]
MIYSLNWGIIGAGNISGQFVHDLCMNNANSTDFKHIIRSIGSSSKDKGEKFIAEHSIFDKNNFHIRPVAETYEEVFNNEQVNIVYLGTPHPFHKQQAIQAFNCGKHVLCEKPATINANDLTELIQLAKSKNLFFMEAVWTRFFPSIDLIKNYIFCEQILGETRRLFVDFSYDEEIEKLPPTSRVRDINLGGGALLDIGIYTITYARILLDDKLAPFNTDFQIKAALMIDKVDKVDYLCSILLNYETGKHAVLTASNILKGKEPFLRLEGTKGQLEIFSSNPAAPKKFKIIFNDGSKPIEYEDESSYLGFIYEANAIAKDIAESNIENSLMPTQESLLVMKIMDEVRKQNGLVYPQEK